MLPLFVSKSSTASNIDVDHACDMRPASVVERAYWRSSRYDCRPRIAGRAAAGEEVTWSFRHAGPVVKRSIAKYQRTLDTSRGAFRHAINGLPRLPLSNPTGDDLSLRRNKVPNLSRKSEPCQTILPIDSGVVGAPHTPATSWAAGLLDKRNYPY